MKRIVILLILTIYLYNLAGYLVAFSVLQQRIRGEVKLMLKETVPQSQLIPFAFHTRKLEAGEYPLVWLKKNEFRYAGGMYDIVSTRTSSESTHYLCINDVQEERLFTNLNLHVQRQTNNSQHQKSFDSFHDAFKNSIHDGFRGDK